MVSARSGEPGEGGQPRDQVRQLRAQQRLAAGDAELLTPELDEEAREPLDLLERQDLGAGRNA